YILQKMVFALLLHLIQTHQLLEEYIAGMKEYSEKVKTMSAEESKKALIRIGVLTPDGKPKENICDI
nr:hypothetical protein [Eubacterium sp.]